MSKIVEGWLFDIYVTADGVVLWLVDEKGGNHRCTQPFQPAFYMSLKKTEAARVKTLGEKFHLPITVGDAVLTEFYSGKLWQVLKVTVADLLQLSRVVRTLERFFPHFVFFNSDISAESMFFYERQLFPLAYGEYRIDETDRLVSYRVEDQFKQEYRIPDLRVLKLWNEHDFAPRFLRYYNLAVEYEERRYELNQEEPEEILGALNWHLQRYDPDIIQTEYGDSILLPMLANLSRKYGIPLLLNRDRSQSYSTTKEASYFTYGKIAHKDGAFFLTGRWHLDTANSFILKEGGLYGLFELSRITQIPPQRQARSSIGTGLSSLQLSYAYRNQILIPAKKKEPEDFKTVETLWLSDRGGLSFLPPAGYHEQIGEIDFASMYPSLMVLHNISPETINCSCCPDSKKFVPELGYRICEKRLGLIPATLKPVVQRRAYFKKRKKEAPKGSEDFKRYDFMQNTLKWMLVTCFGYLGYRNARFGRIEAHESVNAFARHTLLEAKEIAEEDGFELLHGIVDCLWLRKPGTTIEDYEKLCQKIFEKTGAKIDVDGIYRWLLFPASRQDPLLATVNRYVGWYEHGELKVRGLEVRRHDVPGLVSRMQSDILEIMSEAKNIQEIQDRFPRIFQVIQNILAKLRSGQVPYEQLKIRRTISKSVDEYQNRNVSAVVLKELKEKGIELAPGESIEYILVKNYARKGQTSELPQAKSYQGYAVGDEYNVDEYGKLLLKAGEMLLLPFGYDWKKLAEMFQTGDKKRLLKKNEIKLIEDAGTGKWMIDTAV